MSGRSEELLVALKAIALNCSLKRRDGETSSTD